jgi:hypothetical protein
MNDEWRMMTCDCCRLLLSCVALLAFDLGDEERNDLVQQADTMLKDGLRQ